MTEAAVEPLAAAPYTTCGGGVVLEHRYGATLLASFLARTPVPELGDDVTPTVVRLQASDFSPVDDLVVSGPAPDGGLRHVSIGVRRALQLVRSEKESVSLVRSYLRVVTRSWDEIRAGRWRLVLAVADKNSAVKQLDELAVIARAAPSGEVFRTKAGQPGRADEGVRGRLAQLDALVGLALKKGGVEAGEVTAAELAWRLLTCLRIRVLRLEGSDTADRTAAVTSLMPVTRGGTAAEADALFGRLATLADDYAPAGAEVTEWMLRRDLSGFPLARSPSWTQAWRILDGLAERLGDHTRFRLADASAELALDRQDAQRALVTRMRQAGSAPAALVVLGEPEVGKSALSLRAASQLIEDGAPVTSLSLGDLPATALELEERFGGPLTGVLGATATGTARLLLVDGAETVLEGRSELLTDVATAALRAGLGVVAVTRTDGSAAVEVALRKATEAAGLAGVVQRYEVPRLATPEIGQVTAAFPSIARLASEPRAAWLLGRAGLVDLLLRAGATTALPAGPLSEADVFAAVWHHLVRREEVTCVGGPSPDAREQAMLALARGRPALPQLPGPPRPPGHSGPQPGPVRRHPGNRPDTHRADHRPAAGLHPDRRPGPDDLDVARTPPCQPGKTPGHTLNYLPNRW
jgi:hypothetical protein